MAYGDPKQYDCPRAVTERRVQRLFNHVIRSVNVVEHCTVLLNPSADCANEYGAGIKDELEYGGEKKNHCIKRDTGTYYSGDMGSYCALYGRSRLAIMILLPKKI